jgi:prepilin-type N-terminal cleavage/methylation domain-containing protein
MKNFTSPGRSSAAAFTLIEMLVVIAIIAILASLIIPIAGVVGKTRKLKLAQAELAQVEAGIDSYKSKLGFYPPDNGNPTNTTVCPLYYELIGTIGTNGTYVTRDGASQIDTADLALFFNVTGLANSSASAKSTDEAKASESFLTGLRPAQIGQVDPTNHPQVKVLVCTVPWPENQTPAPLPQNPTMNPWRYTSSHPTNNAGAYDLWVDLPIGGKTYRISNWSKQPLIVP